MPRVPLPDAPSVTPVAGQTPYSGVRASPADFGAGEGQAVSQLGQQLGQTGDMLARNADHLQDLANQAAASQAEATATSQVNDYLFDPKTGFFNNRGAAALNAWGDGGAGFHDKIDQIYQSVSNSLTNDDQRRQFDLQWQRIASGASVSASRHVASENRAYLDGAQEAKAQTAINSAALNWNNNDAFGQAVVSAREVAQEQATINGQGLEWANAKTQEYADKAWTARLRSMAQTDAPGALRLLEQAAQGEVRANVYGADSKAVPIAVPPISGMAASQLRYDLFVKANQQNARSIAQDAVSANLSGTPAKTGLEDVADKIVSDGVEGDGDNARSSATGTGQFTNATWLDQMKRNRPDLTAGKSDTDILAMRSNSDLGREMTVNYARDNASKLTAAGLPVTGQSLYLSHFLGPSDAIKAMRADPSTPVEKVVQRSSYDANPEVLGDKTVGDVQAWAADKMSDTGVHAPSPPPTAAAVVQRNYQAGLARIEAQTAGRPELRDQAVAEYDRQTASIIHAQQMSDQADRDTVVGAVLGRNGAPMKSLDEIRQNPDVSSAYDALVRSQPQYIDQIDNLLTRNAKGDDEALSKVSQRTTVQLLGDMRRSPGDPQRMASNNAIYDAFLGSKLTRADFDFLNREFVNQRNPDGERLSQQTGEFTRAVKPMIDKSNPLMGRTDPSGSMQFYHFQVDLTNAMALARKNDKDPYSLLNPASPDYWGSADKLALYQKPLEASVRDVTNRLKPSGGSPAPATAQQRPPLNQFFGK